MELLAGSCLTATERVLDARELAVLLEPDVEDAPPELIDRLARAGLLITDSDDPELQALRRREEALAALHWPERAAAFHFLTRRRDVDIGVAPEDLAAALSPELAARELVAAEGLPPGPFASIDAARRFELPLKDRGDALFRTLLRRRTTRAFDPDSELPLDDLSAILRYAFGAHGYERVGELVSVSKTSPSGGGLHPIEAYPLVVRVESIAPGLYHYDVASHSLALLDELDRETAEQHVDEFTCGQFWFRDAHALVVLAARFERSFWKYRDDDRAYSVLLMDAGHLSQTFYLVCTELGLGAFVTAYVNDRNIEDRLGLDPAAHGVLAVLGCGVPSDVPSAFDPEIVPYVPRETTI